MSARRLAWAGCVVGSVLLHAGVLLTNPTPSTQPGAGSPRLATVAVRFEPAAVRAVLPDPDRLPPTAAGPRPDPPPHPPKKQADTADMPVTAVAEPAYLPRSELSRGPSPRQTIDLPYPDLAPPGRFRAVLTLFIDERGVVQRVRIDEADDTGLPPLLEDTARQTFLQSAFTPGEIEGRPVRSQLRIEVEFATESRGDGPFTAAR